MEANIQRAVDIVWNYLRVGDNIGSADCLIVLGSRDDRVASYAAELADRYEYKTIVLTGGSAHHNDLLATDWPEATEAEHFYTVMCAKGLQQKVLLEDKATNTGDNARLSYYLLIKNGLKLQSFVVVTKPYMERRAKATFEEQWPDKKARIHIASPDLNFENYCNETQPTDEVINIMVGDLERIIYYPSLGFQTKQHVPKQVLEALSILKNEGFNKRSLDK